MFLNIAAQRFNGLNLRDVAGCCIFEISNKKQLKKQSYEKINQVMDYRRLSSESINH